MAKQEKWAVTVIPTKNSLYTPEVMFELYNINIVQASDRI